MLPVEPENQISQQTKEPIKTVQTFWERLDEVLELVKSGGTVSNRLEEILENFSDTALFDQTAARSFLFQPDRISLTSNDDILPAVSIYGSAQTTFPAVQTFSQFRIRLPKALVNVKSIQMLSAVIPNATQNIPDYATFFFYYRLRTIANSSTGNWSGTVSYDTNDVVFNAVDNNYYSASQPNFADRPDENPQFWNFMGPDGSRPNYYDIRFEYLQNVFLSPSFAQPEDNVVADNLLYNRTFQDYNDLAQSLNYCAANGNASIPGDVSFLYNATLNKIIFIPNDTATYFYFIPGYEDPNVIDFIETTVIPVLGQEVALRGYTLNLRCGYTWNGVFPDPTSVPDLYTNNTFANNLYYFLRPKDPAVGFPAYTQNVITANSYGDLVNTSCVKVYADLIFGSTQDSEGNGGLLSIVPVNASNLGVGFYQNNFNNPLEKIPKNITEIGIRLVNDQGQPYLLPNSATVLLELAVEYYK